MFLLHPRAFAQKRVNADHISKIAEINYRIIRHALERDLKSHPLLEQLRAKS
jgi:hypothetical protein